MAAILTSLARDVPATQVHAHNLPALVHAALGSLIKARKVYYTGKGYFLVMPADAASLPRLKSSPARLRRLSVTKRDNACQTEPGGYHHLYQQGTSPPPAPSSSTGWSVTPPSWASSPAPPPTQPATPSQQHRLLARLNSLSPPSSFHNPLNHNPHQQQRHSPRDSPCRVSPQQQQQQQQQQPICIASPKHSGASDSSSNSSGSHSSPDSALQQQQPTLERSQSLRVSKKSMRQMAKGGSLRLSKKDAILAAAMMAEHTNSQEMMVGEENSITTTPSPPKKLERKNSFLGRIFGRKKSASLSSSSSGGGGSPKKEILTFSGQFPPPELEMMAATMGGTSSGRLTDLHSVETQTPPHQRRKPTSPMRPLLPTPQNAAVPTAQVKSGPNGNYIVYEREFNGHGGGNLRSSPAGRPLPQSPPSMLQQDYGIGGGLESTYSDNGGHHQHHIYSQPSSSVYGGVIISANKPPPPAYSSAPPYRPKEALVTSQRPPGSISSPAPQRPVLVTSPKQYNGGPTSLSSGASPQKQVHFAASPRSTATDEESSLMMSPSPMRRAGYANGSGRGGGSHSDSSGSSSGQSSSVSGPSSLDSVLYDDSLVVIEKSNQELEHRLSSLSSGGHGGGRPSSASTVTVIGGSGSNNSSVAYRTQLSHNRIDTIHNNRHLDQEVIYEDSSSLASSRSSSQSTLKPDSVVSPPDHPSLSDLGSILDLSAKFQSLTARKLIAGLSISSIDTLLEVNAAADNKNNNNNGHISSSNGHMSSSNGHMSSSNGHMSSSNGHLGSNNGHMSSNNGHMSSNNGRRNQLLDESTETIDFGVI